MSNFIGTKSTAQNLRVAAVDFVHFNDTGEMFFCISGGALRPTQAGLTVAVLVPTDGFLASVGMQIRDGSLAPPGTYAIQKNQDGTISFSSTIDVGTF